MQIQKSPFPIDFLRNNPEFIIRTSPDRIEERRIDIHFAVLNLRDGAMLIETAHGDFVFTIKGSADPEKEWELEKGATASEILASMERKILHNAQINKHYTVSAWIYNNGVRLRFTAKEGLTGDYVRITLPQAADINELTLIGTRRGRTRVPKENHHIIAQYQLNDGTLTPAMLLDDNEGTVKVETSILTAWIGEPDIPRADETFGIQECGFQTLTAKLLYAETTNGNTGVVKISNPVTLLNAKVKKEDRDNNRPDWKTRIDTKMWQQSDIEIYGQNNDETVWTDTETEQYIYVCNLTDVTKRKTVIVWLFGTDGSESYQASVDFPPMSICRIPCGFGAIIPMFGTPPRIGMTIRWEVEIVIGRNPIMRTYMARPRPYGAVTALLLNRCRLFESMVFNEIAGETQTEGDSIESISGSEYLIRNRKNSVVLRTGRKTAAEISLLRDALDQPGNLLLDEDGRHAWRITFAPDTLKLKDTGEDLIEAEVKAICTERIDRISYLIGSGSIIDSETSINDATTIIGK